MRGKVLAAAVCGCTVVAPAVAGATTDEVTQPDPTALTTTVEGKLQADAAHTLHAAVQTAASKAQRKQSHGSQAGAAMPAMFQAIAQCESGGDPSARSGPYGGLFQFDAQTWASVGGTGDPASASPQEQLKRAEILYQQRGTSAWPVCGRRV